MRRRVILRNAKHADTLVTEWHQSKSKLKLHEYMGLTWEEYKVYVLNEKEFWRIYNETSR